MKSKEMNNSMTTEESTQTSKPPSEAETPERSVEARQNLYEKQKTVYRSSVSEDPESGFSRYGFGYFYSVPAEERFLIQSKIGMPCREAADHYNLGNAHASREEYDRAIECWKKALKLDSSLHAAVFNIALACERLGKTGEAHKHYETYLGSVEDPEEKQRVEQHLAQLQA
jgi:tetratricopeptide (TPR) repeat protein